MAYNEQRTVNQYLSASEAGNLFGDSRLGAQATTNAQKALERLTAQGYDISSLSPQTFEDGTGDQSRAVNYLTRLHRREMDPNAGNIDRRTNNFRVRTQNRAGNITANNAAEAGKAYFNENVEPVFDKAQGALDQLASTDAMNAERIAALQSQIGMQVKAAEQSRLRRVGAVLGLRGLADSPAGAALASRSAAESDRILMDTMRQMGIDVTELNRNSKRQDVAAATQLATNRLGAYNASIKNDQFMMAGLQRDTAALIEALYTRDETAKMLEKQYKDATSESTLDKIGGYVDLGKNIFSLGTSIASGFGKSPVGA